MWLQNDRIIMDVPGATTEVATLKQVLSEAENKAAKERIEREKQEARVGAVQQELQALVTKHETLELNSKTRESELATARESAKSAKAEAQKALQEIDAMKKIAAGKAFYMQSKHVKVNYLLLTRIWSSPGAFTDLPRSLSDAAQFY
jgi:chromosome segregation ATPase